MNSSTLSKSESDSGTPTVYVIDDEQEQRGNIAALASQEGWRCVGFGTAAEFHACEEKNRPGCLVLDYRLENEDGLTVLEQLNQRHDALPTVAVTGYADVPIATEFMRRGAINVLQKPYTSDELLSNIRVAIEQDSQTLDRRRKMEQMAQWEAQLTDRRRQVVDLVLQGQLNKRIAVLLGVSQRAIENERADILEIFQVRNAVQLATQLTEYRSFVAAKNLSTSTPSEQPS